MYTESDVFRRTNILLNCRVLKQDIVATGTVNIGKTKFSNFDTRKTLISIPVHYPILWNDSI